MSGHPVQRAQTLPKNLLRPATVNEALAALADCASRGVSAKPIAGGTDLMVELDRAEHGGLDTLIDLTAIAGLDTITEPRDGRVTIGALVTHAQCVASETIDRVARPLAQAAAEIGSPQLRNRATVAGNLITASPANDTISALAVLNAELTIASVRGERTVPLADFHHGVRETDLAAGELVTAITFDALDESWKAVFVKAGLRRYQAISVVHVAVACRFAPAEAGSSAPTVAEARIALGSVAPTIARATETERFLTGTILAAQSAIEAGQRAAAEVDPIDDLRSPAAYRSELVAEMVRRALLSLGGEPEPSATPVLLGARSKPARPAVSTAGGITATVNGEPVSGAVVGASLLDWLRERGFNGTKEGCAEGECGACTVHLDGQAVLSCLVVDVSADGATITTIEGLAATHPDLQAAFVERGAVQCGYCIPGFVMSAAKLIDEGAADEIASIKAGLSGNLCRCTGYYKIEEAIAATASARNGSEGGQR